MEKKKPIAFERTQLLEELYDQYGKKRGITQRCFYLRKKYFWLFVIRAVTCLKRAMDIICGSIALIIFFPIMLIIAFIIKISDGGPIFYVSERVGKWGEEFRFIKFRTMVVNAENLKEDLSNFLIETECIRFKLKEDPRTTPFGAILRKMSLDELPQLWNVIKGDMSLVGPRPPLPTEVAKYSINERRRLDVKPGLTCIWQVSGRSDIAFQKQVMLDLEYIESQSLWLDIFLLLKTIPAVLFGRGAY